MNRNNPIAALNALESFACLGEKYLNTLAVNHGSLQTIANKRSELTRFADWCLVRSLERPDQLTQTMAEGYQNHLYHHRKIDGKPLTIGTQRGRMTIVKTFYRWLVKANYLHYSPWENVEFPSLPRQLPRAVLSEEEMEKVLLQPDLNTPVGLRDRAMMETLYSTGVRRNEILNIKTHDLDRYRGLLRINQGKGNKDRIIPIGDRALHWIESYLDQSRPELVKRVSEETLFISHFGKMLSRTQLTKRLGAYVRQTGLGKPGSVHIFRHTTATLMLENGADIRHIQALLGHEDLSTTQIYTHVAITHLKDVHSKTHPARLIEKHSV